MFDAGIKVNYGRIADKMGKSTESFVRNTVANIDKNVASNTRIKISTFKAGELDPKGIDSGMIVLTNVRDFLSFKAKKAGIKNIFKGWEKLSLDKEALSELFSTENILSFLRKIGNSK